MKIFAKSFIAIFALLLFLSPLSINIQKTQYQKVSSENTYTQAITIDSNIAQAQTLISNLKCQELADFSNCVVNGILNVYELLIFYLTSAVLVITGLIFDIILYFSLSSNFYRGGLMESGWSIVRDFTNIIFIFALLIMAFKLVLNQDNGKTKSSLIKTILIALVINFSLFTTFIIIDASNLLAFTFYNRIEASGQYQAPGSGTTGENTSSLTDMVQVVTAGQPSLSLAIASKINPQTIITQSGADGLLEKFIIVTSAGILNILMIYVFGSVTLLFLGRSLGLMVSGIIAPLAFASITVPSLQSLPYIGFGNWLKQLISLAFMAPIFLFLLYLIVTFLGDEGVLRGLSASGDSGGFLGKIMTVFIFFMMIGGLMLLAKKITTKMAGELGGMVSKGVAGLATGLVAGAAVVATGGAAAAGGALRLGGSAITAAGGKGTGKLARGVRGLGKGVSGTGKFGTALSRFDVSKVPGFKSMANASGVKGLGDKIGKVTKVSGDTIEDKVRYGAAAAPAAAKDIISGRKREEEKAAETKKRKERREESEKGDDGLYGWQRKLQDEKVKNESEKAKAKMKAARKEELDSTTEVFTGDGEHNGKNLSQALKDAEGNAANPTKQIDAQKEIEIAKSELKKEEAKIEPIELDIEIAEKGVRGVKETLDNAKTKVSDLREELKNTSDPIGKNMIKSTLDQAVRDRNNAQSELKTKTAELSDEKNKLTAQKKAVKTAKENIETKEKEHPVEKLKAIKKEIDLKVNVAADEKVATTYDGKDDIAKEVAKNIRQKKINLEDKK